ncbi:PDZ domain-containing protein [Kineococcus sp. T13]|uniref:S1C family serine protease n=1 Tax=Kineococcus vitellinus TaxID=2696565 RepID=UPI001411E056|nr:trypsin-like peptidase domain-containing protein [Kineococcus vitellinus]NAZ75562.1 PDZ domain-containing protein [Kineococcus vitellinus]
MNRPDERGPVSTQARSDDGTARGEGSPTRPATWDWWHGGHDRSREQAPGQPYGQAYGQAHGQHDPWTTPGGPTPPGGSDDGRGGSGGGRGPRRGPGWFGVAGAAIASAVAASALTAGLVGAFGQDASGGASAGTSSSASSGSARVQGVSETTVNWQGVVSAVAPSVVSVTVASSAGEAEGSGIVYDASGHVVTNNHVVTGAGSGATITVTLSDGREYRASVVGTDPATDLAVIRLQDPPGDLQAATFADSDDVVAGQAVMALGNPLGLSGSATTGIVSAVDRPVLTTSEESPSAQDPFGQQFGQQQTTGETAATNAIQTDAAINPGNSGGALLDSSGRVVGVNSSIASLSSASSASQSGSIGLGFAIPSNEVRMIADQLVETGSAQHAWLGVSLAQEAATVTVDGAGRQGAQVAQVQPGTPAADAGLQAGDVVTAVDGQATDGYESLTATIRGKAVGSTVQLTVVRGGQERTLEATLTARDEG